jgi:DNA-binding GntR family transcriptional regulator
MDTTTTASPRSATDRVYGHVKQAILDRTYAGGALLTEGQIADVTGVSRTPVREALLRLEGEGLLRLYPKKGALVLALSAREADEVFQAREMVEAFAAAVCLRLDEGDRAALLAALDGHLADMRRHRAAADAQALSASDRAFHAAVVAAAGNGVVARFYESLRDRQMCMTEVAMRVSPERMDRAVAEHAAILDAVRAGDGDRLGALIAAHVHAAAGHLRGLS